MAEHSMIFFRLLLEAALRFAAKPSPVAATESPFDVGSVTAWGDIVAAAATVATAIVILINAIPPRWFMERVLLRPVNRASRRGKTRPQRDQYDDARTLLRGYLHDILNGVVEQPSEFASEVNSSRKDDEGTGLTKVLRQIFELTRDARAPINQGALSSALWPDRVAQVLQSLGALEGYLSATYYLIPLHFGESHAGNEFRTLVSAYMGSIVLADGSANRSGVIDRVLIQHDSTWSSVDEPHKLRSGDNPGATPAGASGYAKWHANYDETVMSKRSRDSGDSAFEGKLSADLREGQLLRDHDGRIFDLWGVRTLFDSRSHARTVLLETRESCYNVSEHWTGQRNKHLESLPDLAAPTNVVQFAEDSDHNYGRTVTALVDPASDPDVTVEAPSRVLLLNTCLTLVSYQDPENPVLVLSRRSDQNNIANDVISATVGGVFHHTRPGEVGDVDSFGNPDPAIAIQRQLFEELGFGPNEIAPNPIAVYYANVQGKPTEDKYTSAQGQLVATVSYLANTRLSEVEIIKSREDRADLQLGKFQAVGFTTIPLPTPTGLDFATRVANASEFLQVHLVPRIHELDQNATIGALYAGAAIYGVAAMRSALAGEQTPWWATHWVNSVRPRLFCDPRALVKDFSTIASAQVRWEDQLEAATRPSP